MLVSIGGFYLGYLATPRVHFAHVFERQAFFNFNIRNNKRLIIETVCKVYRFGDHNLDFRFGFAISVERIAKPLREARNRK